MTLAFLGAVGRGRLPQLAAIARRSATRGFDIHLDRTACWPRHAVVYAAPQRVPPALAALVANLVAALREDGFEPEARVWQPHVTLLRDARAPRDGAPLAIDWPVRDFVLIESRGGEYRRCGCWPLAPI